MTADEIEKVVQYTEELWLSRTPSKTVSDVLASYRVTVSEIGTWAKSQGINFDRTDEDYQLANSILFVKLRKRFPQERWTALNAATKSLLSKYKIKFPRSW